MKTIGERFKYFRNIFNKNQKEFGEIVGIPASSISKIEQGIQEPSETVIKVMEYAYQLNRDWLLRDDGDVFLAGENAKKAGDKVRAVRWVAGKGEDPPASTGEGVVREDYIYVPRYDVRAGAGAGAVIESERVVDHLAFKNNWVSNVLGVSGKNLALITTVGDSMHPTLQNGDLVLLDTSRSKVEGDAIYCFRDGDGNLMIKRIQRLPDGVIVVISDNKEYKQYSLVGEKAESLAVVGRVVWFGRQI